MKREMIIEKLVEMFDSHMEEFIVEATDETGQPTMIIDFYVLAELAYDAILEGEDDNSWVN